MNLRFPANFPFIEKLHLLPMAFVTAVLVWAPAAAGAQLTSGETTVYGSVRDAHGDLAGATVVLTYSSNRRSLTATTDAHGVFRFTGLESGTYSLRATLPGYAEAAYAAFTIAAGESKKADLILAPASQSSTAASSAPAFFDEPSFIVAGVTESAYQGGHGSDTMMRSAEAITKAAASLGLSATAASYPKLSPAPTIQALEETAHREPASFDANYNLAAALVGAGDYARARALIPTLVVHWNRAELHHLLAEADERSAHPVEAVHEYELAANLDPSETNLFDWGTELLTHRADEPAVQVYSKGHRLFPGSTRMILGLAAAWYARGSYDQAAARFVEAADVNPRDPEPYLLLAKVQSPEITASDAYLDRLARFANLQPQNALANYYYASALSKRCLTDRESKAAACAEVQPLLEKALRLDPKLGAAYLELGIFYSGQRDYPRAVDAYRKAIEVTPQFEEAHYRLAQAYRLTDQPAKAQEELAIYHDLSRKSADQFAHDRAEIQQFVYHLKGQASSAKP